MPERDGDNKQFRDWHEAARGILPGNLLRESKFVSFQIDLNDGISYLLMSITEMDFETGLPEGMYALTNIPQGMEKNLPDLVKPIVNSILDLLVRPYQKKVFVGVPPEINSGFSSDGITVNLSGSIGVKLIGYSGSGMLIKLNQINMEDLSKNAFFDLL